MRDDKLKQLGKGAESYEALKDPTVPHASDLDTFTNKYPGRSYLINIEFPEFTSLCPQTGQPDHGTIRIHYCPKKWCVESKSLKIYFFRFRQQGMFMEQITNKILDDLVEALDPVYLRVVGDFAPRGATHLKIVVEHKDGDFMPPDVVRLIP